MLDGLVDQPPSSDPGKILVYRDTDTQGWPTNRGTVRMAEAAAGRTFPRMQPYRFKPGLLPRPDPALEAPAGLDGLLEVRARLEAHGLAGLDLNRLAGARVHCLAGLGLAHGEGAEGGQREPALALELTHDRLDQRAGGGIGRNTRAFGLLLDDRCNESLAHGMTYPVLFE